MFWILIFSALLISSLGLFMLLSKKHILSILIGIELILNGINLIFIVVAKTQSSFLADIMIMFILVITACEVAIGLAILTIFFKKSGSISIDTINKLKG